MKHVIILLAIVNITLVLAQNVNAVSRTEPVVWRSGTSLIERYHKNIGELTHQEQRFARNALDTSQRDELIVIKSDKFPLRVHYESEDFRELAEHVLAITEECWEVQVYEWGFREPPPDCGLHESDDLDVFILDLQPGIGGYAAFACYDESTPEASAASFVAISDSLPDNFLRAAVAHEFNHVLQNATDYWESITFKEYTSTWAMEWMYPEDDQYFAYLRSYQRNPHWAMHEFSFTNTYQYGAGIYLHFLTEYYSGGDPSIVVDIWEACIQNEHYNDPDFIQAMREVIPEYTGGMDTFEDALGEYAGWRVITSSRDDGKHFADGGLWPPGAEVVMDTILDLAEPMPQTMIPVNPPYDFGFSYVQLVNPGNASSDAVLIDFEGDTDVDWVVMVMECRDDHAMHIKHRMEIENSAGQFQLTPAMLNNSDQIIIGVVNVSHDEFHTNTSKDPRSYQITLRNAMPDTALRVWTDRPMTGPDMEYVLNIEMEYYGAPDDIDFWLFLEVYGAYFSLFNDSDGMPVPIRIPVIEDFTVTTPVLSFDLPQLDEMIPVRWHAALLAGQSVLDYTINRNNLLLMFR
jgi:hypothetical protein